MKTASSDEELAFKQKEKETTVPGVKVQVGDFGMPGSRVALVILDMAINHSYLLILVGYIVKL